MYTRFTRVEDFLEEEQERINSLLKDELDIRARAAEDLAEPFEIDGVEIERGCDKDGTIKVNKGIERLAKLADTGLIQEVKDRGEYKAIYQYFMCGDIRFENLVDFQKIKDGAEDENMQM